MSEPNQPTFAAGKIATSKFQPPTLKLHHPFIKKFLDGIAGTTTMEIFLLMMAPAK